eukprot:scaffold1315_cov217-Chaetoceros_neogracile.AAC.6
MLTGLPGWYNRMKINDQLHFEFGNDFQNDLRSAVTEFEPDSLNFTRQCSNDGDIAASISDWHNAYKRFVYDVSSPRKDNPWLRAGWKTSPCFLYQSKLYA